MFLVCAITNIAGGQLDVWDEVKEDEKHINSLHPSNKYLF